MEIIVQYHSRVLRKVLENIVVSNLTKHLANSNILSELQHGFREKTSCETQLVMLVEESAKNRQTGKQTDLYWYVKILVKHLTKLYMRNWFQNYIFMEFGAKH